MRVVIDTNVYVSGSLWKGKEAKIIDLCISRSLENFTSFSIMDEIERVLHYGKFQLTEFEVEQLMKIYVSFSRIVKPNVEIRIIENDPSDNKFLECAMESRSSVLITGDLHLLQLTEFASVRIMNANSFLEEFHSI